eukprot:scaffold24572_cov65-Phaeocystis_antarctica.AAC.5
MLRALSLTLDSSCIRPAWPSLRTPASCPRMAACVLWEWEAAPPEGGRSRAPGRAPCHPPAAMVYGALRSEMQLSEIPCRWPPAFERPLETCRDAPCWPRLLVVGVNKASLSRAAAAE